MRNFESWEIQDLQKTFSLKRHYDGFPPLDDWLSAVPDFNESENSLLEGLRHELARMAEFWNEEELKINFIGALVKFIHFNDEYISVFYNRRLKGTVEGIEMGGWVDMMVASGFQKPVEPTLSSTNTSRKKRRTPTRSVG